MKFSIAAVALAAVAVASPTGMERRTGDHDKPSGGTCNNNGDNNGRVTCCNSAIPILGQLACNVLAIGNTCNSNQEVYCCKTDAIKLMGRKDTNELGTIGQGEDALLAGAPGCLYSQKTTNAGAVRRCGDNVGGGQEPEPEQTGRHERDSR
ncbi:hypothetical protein PWT90_01351 [Aphanocladium album]|nr:hypothetical protein PWT90_01351 [Aphanocladium album]